MSAQDLMNRLRDADRHVRDDAFDRIASSRDPELLSLLADQAHGDDPFVEALFCRYLSHREPAEAFDPLRRLLASPNAPTREHACQTLATFAVEQRLEVLLELLTASQADVVCFALRELGQHRRSVAIPAIADLLLAADDEVTEAAFEALSHIDHPRAARAVRPLLTHEEPRRRVLALDALGLMEHFRRWRRLLPGLDDPEASVRMAAVRNLSRLVGQRAHGPLLKLLERESDQEVIKLILSRLALEADLAVATALIPLAAMHDDPQVRRAAGWVVEEFEDELLGRALDRLLETAGPEVRAYGLVKMGTREMAGAGERMVRYLDGDQPPRVLYAALEGLGFLRQPRWLDRVVPFIDSSDPMTAYVATLTAAQLAENLSDCPPLLRILQSPDEERVALKQVVLQFMIDTISWTFDDAIYALLVQLLGSSNENTGYLAAILLGRARGRQDLVEPLLTAALGHPHEGVMEAARESLNEVLDGRLVPVFERLDRQPGAIHLLPQLRWDTASVARGLELIDAAAQADELSDADLRVVAEAVVAVDAAAVRAALDGGRLTPRWHHALGLARLDALGDLSTPEAQSEWREMIAADDDKLVSVACARALEHRPPWATEILLRRAAGAGTTPMADTLRHAVRELMDL